MPDIQPIPAPPPAAESCGVDTSIDRETPELLSPEQFDRYTETVSALLAASGLEVRTPDPDTPSALEVSCRGTGFTLELDLREDRSAEWSITGADEVAEGTTAAGMAAAVARLLGGRAHR